MAPPILRLSTHSANHKTGCCRASYNVYGDIQKESKIASHGTEAHFLFMGVVLNGSQLKACNFDFFVIKTTLLQNLFCHPMPSFKLSNSAQSSSFKYFYVL